MPDSWFSDQGLNRAPPKTLSLCQPVRSNYKMDNPGSLEPCAKKQANKENNCHIKFTRGLCRVWRTCVTYMDLKARAEY